MSPRIPQGQGIRRSRRNRDGGTAPYTCLDLFCGAGGFSEGLRQAGFHTVAANDFDVWAGRTYAASHANHGTHFVLGDITVPAIKEELLHYTGCTPVDVVVGGPPCQAFSQVRNHNRIIDDPRNSLYRHFISILKSVRPRVFIMENVPGLQNLAGGAIRRQIVEDLELDGEYRVASRVVDAAAFGVPQIRLRVVFVGVRKDLHADPVFPVGASVSELPRLLRSKQGDRWAYMRGKVAPGNRSLNCLLDRDNVELVSAAQAISDLRHLRANKKLVRRPSDVSVAYELPPESEYQLARRRGSFELYNADVPMIRDDTVTRLQAIPRGGNFRDLPEALSARYLNGEKWGPELGRDNLSRKYFFAYRKLHPDHLSWTLNTKADCVYHYSEARALSVREFARLHSFDDTYHFLHGDRHSRYRQIGNAVPPLMARAIARAVLPILEAHDDKSARKLCAAE